MVPPRHFGLAAILGGAVSCLLSACSRDASSPVERDPYFVRGMSLRQSGKYREAAQAFSRCLLMRPRSAKAHLQLATLYDDYLADTAAAVHYYRTYLALVGEDAASGSRAWLASSERELLRELRQRHPDEEPYEPPSPEPVVDAGRPPQPTERERSLVRTIKRLNGELRGLRKQLAQSESRPEPEPDDQEANPAADEEAGETAEAAAQSYTVKQGDTLSGISSASYGSTKHWRALAAWNKDVLKNGDILQPGMLLEIPPLRMLASEGRDDR